MPTIQFKTFVDRAFEEFRPIPASSAIPQWFQDTPSDMVCPVTGNTKWGRSVRTCPGITDWLNTGYYIQNTMDIRVEYENGMFSAKSGTYIDEKSHPHSQFEKYEAFENDAIKLRLPWVTVTPENYSCMYLDPYYNQNPYFTTTQGIMDTDSFLGNDLVILEPKVKHSFTIPANTTIVQIIPYLREDWTMECSMADFDFIDKVEKGRHKLFPTEDNRSRNGAYRRQFWAKKKYK